MSEQSIHSRAAGMLRKVLPQPEAPAPSGDEQPPTEPAAPAPAPVNLLNN